MSGVPSEVSSSKGQYNGSYRGVGNINTMAITTSFVAGQTYYAIYYKTLTNYYYNNNSYTNRNLYRNEYLANSNDTNYSSVIATNNAIKVNYTTAGGPGGSEWFGLSNAQDTTPEYSTVAQAATSCDTTLYTVYKFNVNYSAGANVSSVGSSTGSCNITTSSTSCNVTLPSITPNSGYTSAGWSTTSGATTGTEAGQNYSLNSNNITLYANAGDFSGPLIIADATDTTITATITDPASGVVA